MRIWFDADNGPHVLIMEPLVRRLLEDGHEVRFTARDRNSTCELLDLYGFGYRTVGKEYGKGRPRKVAGTIVRAMGLARVMRSWHPHVCFGHGSRALPIAARLLRVPSVTMYDYEWVDPVLFNWGCRRILLPSVIDDKRCRQAGIDVHKVSRFPGLKEHLYLGERSLDQTVADDLGLRSDSLRVLLRPPATKAHYHVSKAEELLQEVLNLLRGVQNLQMVFLRRSDDQLGHLEGFDPGKVIIPQRVYHGPSLVATMDVMFSGGGTMTREAAVLGVPSYSFFRGRLGRVDESLEHEHRLVMLRSGDDVRAKVSLEKRRTPVTLPDSRAIRDHVVDQILAAARTPAAGTKAG
jgi:predicted glycosyltransferase